MCFVVSRQLIVLRLEVDEVGLILRITNGLLVISQLLVVLILEYMRLLFARPLVGHGEFLPSLADYFCNFGEGEILTFERFSDIYTCVSQQRFITMKALGPNLRFENKTYADGGLSGACSST